MPWKSQAQERWGNSSAGQKALGKDGVAEFNTASKGASLPVRAPHATPGKPSKGGKGNKRGYSPK